MKYILGMIIFLIGLALLVLGISYGVLELIVVGVIFMVVGIMFITSYNKKIGIGAETFITDVIDIVCSIMGS
ncbi:MAG: hypothetical protein R3Y13_02320 [bacterium]